MWRSLLSVLIIASVSACSTSPSAIPSVVRSSPTAAPPPTTRPSLSAEPQPNPTAAIEAAASLYVLRDDEIGVSGEIVVPIRNVGAGWIRIRPTKTRYTISASDGAVLLEDAFAWSYPSELGPGDQGYLATQIRFNGGTAADVERIDVVLSSEPIDEADTVTLALSDLTTMDDVEGGVSLGVITTGTVTNPSSKVLRGYDIGAFYFDGDGTFLGFTALNPGILRAHQTADFRTLPMAAGFDRTAIARIEVVPSSWCDCGPE
jgi:hypothetical protein